MIELTTSLVFLWGVFMNDNPASNDISEDKAVREEIVIKANKPITLEAYVREYFKDNPVLAEIARCESTFRHYASDGKVIRGLVDPRDVGVMQINEFYHLKTSKSLGYDIHTLEGNMEYAKFLYEKKGTNPWSASSKCWSAYKDIAKI